MSGGGLWGAMPPEDGEERQAVDPPAPAPDRPTTDTGWTGQAGRRPTPPPAPDYAASPPPPDYAAPPPPPPHFAASPPPPGQPPFPPGTVYPPAPAGPGDPIGPGAPGPGSGRSRTPIVLAVAGVVLVAVIAAAIVIGLQRSHSTASATGGGTTGTAAPRTAASADNESQASVQPSDASVGSDATSSDPATDPGRTAAQAVDSLLSTSARARAGVQPALDRIAGCQGDDSDTAALQDAADSRTALRSQLAGIDLGGIDSGATVKTDLARVFTYSIDADLQYEAWGEQAMGCTGTAPQDTYKQRGDSYSARATVAKREFLALWNQVARQYGLTVRDPSQI